MFKLNTSNVHNVYALSLAGLNTTDSVTFTSPLGTVAFDAEQLNTAKPLVKSMFRQVGVQSLLIGSLGSFHYNRNSQVWALEPESTLKLLTLGFACGILAPTTSEDWSTTRFLYEDSFIQYWEAL